MSLGKLLATGRSLVGGAPDMGRYNLSKQTRLPKFGPVKNPFAVPAAASAVVGPEISPASSVTTSASSPAPGPLTQPGHTGRVALWLARGRRVAGRAVAWVWPQLRAGAAWVGQRVRRPQPKSLIPRFGKPAVQPEFSLEDVKVVRGDLTESDLEIVVAETSTGTQAAPKAPVAPVSRGPVPPALKKLTDRILGPQVH